MRISVDIDDDLLREAMTLSDAESREAVVNEALAEYVKTRRQRKMLETFGQIEYDPGYDYKAERKKR